MSCHMLCWFGMGIGIRAREFCFCFSVYLFVSLSAVISFTCLLLSGHGSDCHYGCYYCNFFLLGNSFWRNLGMFRNCWGRVRMLRYWKQKRSVATGPKRSQFKIWSGFEGKPFPGASGQETSLSQSTSSSGVLFLSKLRFMSGSRFMHREPLSTENPQTLDPETLNLQDSDPCSNFAGFAVNMTWRLNH